MIVLVAFDPLNLLVCKWLLKEKQWKGELAFTGIEVGKADFRLFLNKKKSHLVPIINKRIQQMREAKEIDAIVEKYTKS